ncbi:MAG: hypothetical protein WCJ51_05200 [Candidatus Moraniibacteriota bacterium]
MQEYKFPFNSKKTILALGAESAGNFSLWENNRLHCSEDFGDLAVENNFLHFQSALKKFLKDNNCKPDIILSDLHPLFQSTKLAQQLSKKYTAQYLPVQHLLAHIFSAIGDRIIEHGAWNIKHSPITKIQSTNQPCHCESASWRIIRSNPDRCQALDRHGFSSTKILAMTKSSIQNTIFGVACDGTGLGEDEKIWGGEVFAITNNQTSNTKRVQNSKLQITRIGHLENQILLGGELAIQEPARMLIAILFKISNAAKKFPPCHSGLDPESSKSHEINTGLDSRFHGNDININIEKKKNIIFSYIKKYYSRSEFEVLWNQLEQNFNCVETSSTARVLDAVSVLLGFSKNERLSKHQPVKLLEENSTKPYLDINPKIKILNPNKAQNPNDKKSAVEYILETTPLFEYLLENLHKDKKRLAATAQKYIADGLMEIIKISNQSSVISHQEMEVADHPLPVTAFFASGGIMNNKIISAVLENQEFYLNQKIPRGDAGISFGQIVFYLLTK